MQPSANHRTVHSLSLSILQRQVTDLLKEGWKTLGSPALMQPADHSSRACWVQQMYFQGQPSVALQPLTPLAKSGVA